MADLLHVLTSALPHSSSSVLQSYVAPLEKVFAHYEVNTPNRQAAFLAQVSHESGGFLHIKENLNYSADGLMATWPSRFNATLAASCARNPEKIANVVYSSRMGNGPPESGDGAIFIGRGLIMVTGKANYTACGTALGKGTLRETIAYLETPEGATMSAGWFWSTNGLNAFADKGDMLTITKRINGGVVGLQERVTLYATFRKLLA